MPISSPNPMFDHLLESSHRDDSNKWSKIGFGEEIIQVASVEADFMRLIWSSGLHEQSNPSAERSNHWAYLFIEIIFLMFSGILLLL